MKKISMGIIILFLMFVAVNVNADEVYYTNNNGLTFTQFQYETMVEILSEEIVQNMDATLYNDYEVASMKEDNFKMTSYIDTESNSNSGVSTYGTFYETQSKKLIISSNCTSSYCSIIVTNTWKKNPAVRSYDMIGVRLSGTNFYNDTIVANITVAGTTYNRSGMYGSSKGVGCALKLRSGDVDFGYLKVYVKPQGTVFASYQHAVRSISLSTALDFTFDSNGYGGVFNYPSSLPQTFDQMAGVYMTL